MFTEPWSTGRGAFPDHCDRDNQLRAGICLAQKVMGWRRQCPHARIVLVGFGTGAHVALLSTFYTAPGTLDRVILLSASVAADYDLRSALQRARAANDAGQPHVLVVPIDQAHHHAEFDRFHDFEPAPGSATA